MNGTTLKLLWVLERDGISGEQAQRELRTAETILREMGAIEESFRERTEPIIVMEMRSA